MENCLKFYIDGQWVDPVDPKPFDVINPANEQVIGQIMMGNEEDLNKAVAAAKKAFPSFSRTSVQERLELMDAIMAAYQNRYAEIAETISAEMGAPMAFRPMRKRRPAWVIWQPFAVFWLNISLKKCAARPRFAKNRSVYAV